MLTGELDLICPPRHGRVVADGIPGARFEVLAGEAHQPFQESPEAFNRRVDAFWQQVDTLHRQRHQVGQRHQAGPARHTGEEPTP